MSKYIWYHQERRYKDGDFFVSWDTIRDQVDEMAQRYADDLLSLGGAAIEPYNEPEFFALVQKTRGDLENLHAAVTVIALGGLQATTAFAQENTTIWQVEESRLAEQLSYFDRLAFDIVTGAVALSLFPRRISNYALAAFGTFERVSRMREAVAGKNVEEKRIITAKNSCNVCIIEAEKGWQPRGILRDIGDSDCLYNCRCYFIYRSADGNVWQ